MPDPPTGLPFNAKPKKEDLDAVMAKCHLPRPGDPPPEPGNGKEEYDKVIFHLYFNLNICRDCC